MGDEVRKVSSRTPLVAEPKFTLINLRRADSLPHRAVRSTLYPLRALPTDACHLLGAKFRLQPRRCP